MAIRTRFAPSPTGYLHIGGARTALYNWAWTRRLGGTFVLRIEDTDRERSTAESEAAVLGGLAWLGIDWDEGPFRQSERGAHYAAAIERLLASERAYRCICTPAEIEERRQATVAAGGKWTYDRRCAEAGYGPDCGPHAVRLRVPTDGKLGFDDAVFGPSGQEAREIGDMVIRRTDGSPLYHLAVVVDDVAMGITHVIRGADHLNNTPFQLALYGALDATPPHFAHVPLIVGSDGRKLSKRRDPVAVQHFRDAGYLPEAMCNWLVRLGWSHGDQEIFSMQEIRTLFDLDAVQRASGQADPGKLDWLNQHYIKERPRDRLAREVAPLLAAAGTPVDAEDAAFGALARPVARAQQDAGRDGGARALLRRAGRRARPRRRRREEALEARRAARARGPRRRAGSRRELGRRGRRGGLPSRARAARGPRARQARAAGAHRRDGLGRLARHLRDARRARSRAQLSRASRARSPRFPRLEKRHGARLTLRAIPRSSNGRTTGSGPVN